jgi:hypothetical protein
MIHDEISRGEAQFAPLRRSPEQSGPTMSLPFCRVVIPASAVDDSVLVT